MYEQVQRKLCELYIKCDFICKQRKIVHNSGGRCMYHMIKISNLVVGYKCRCIVEHQWSIYYVQLEVALQKSQNVVLQGSWQLGFAGEKTAEEVRRGTHLGVKCWK